MQEAQSQNALSRSRSIQNLKKSADSFKRASSISTHHLDKNRHSLRSNHSAKSATKPITTTKSSKLSSRRSFSSTHSSSAGRHSSIVKRLSRPSSRARSSTRFAEDDYEEIPSKCKCAYCRIRHPPPWLVEEQDRILNNGDKVIDAIEDNVKKVFYDLQKLVAFKSISVEPDKLTESMKALDWVQDRLANLKFITHEHYIPDDPHNCFEESHQKVLFARYFSSPAKSTLLIYSHLDVVPADRECWLQDPFELVLDEGLLYGRGVTSGKGMLVGWLQAFECWLQVHGDLPINVKIIVDMLHEVGSSGLQEYITERNGFFLDVDYMVFDANSWLTNDQPVVACSLSGWAHFGIEVNGGNKSLEGGLAGGLVYEPMIDLCHFMNSLVDDDHEILIPHIGNNVRRLSTDEYLLLEKADFVSYVYREELYVRRLRNEDNKVEMLQSRWCKPALTMHGVQGAASRPGCSRVLPMHVVGKFSIRLVPDQDVGEVQHNVKEHLKRTARELNIGTRLTVQMVDACEPISWAPDTKMTQALIRALVDIYEVDPVVTRAIPVCLPIASVLQKLIDKPLMLLPFSRRRDRHHQENECIEELCIMQHAKVCAALLYELATIKAKCKCDVVTDYCNKRGVAERLHDLYGEEEDEKPKRKRKALLSFFTNHEHIRSRPAKKYTFKEKIERFFRQPCEWRESKMKKRLDTLRESIAVKRPKIKERIQNIFRSPLAWKKAKVKERIAKTSRTRFPWRKKISQQNFSVVRT